MALRRKWLERLGLAVLTWALATIFALVIVRPPSPLAAADRLFESIAFRFFAPPRPQSQDIAIIAITEETLALFPYRSPIDRGFLARLIETAAAAGPRAIGIDILFDRPTEPAKDGALQEAMRHAKMPVVAVSVTDEAIMSPEQRRYLEAFFPAGRYGFGNLIREHFDGTIRQHVPVTQSGQVSFTAALARAVGAEVPERPFAIAWRSRPADGKSPFPIYPAHLVSRLPRDWLHGKILLIGSLLPGQDEHRTVASTFGPPTYGVEIHAHILSQMLDGKVGAEPIPEIPMISAAGAAGIGMIAAAALSGWPMVALLISLIASLWGGSLAAYSASGTFVPCLAPSLALVFSSGAVRFRCARRDRRDRQSLLQLFSRFVGEPVVAEIWKDRETFLAGGRPRPQELTATVLFSDIAGFTPICEQLPPTPLIDWLDRYIDTMAQVVHAHHGIVLRFIGDGILAVFGAPVARTTETEIDADARNAVRCALAMQEAMLRLNTEWRKSALPQAGIRVGIHTGPLVAGSLGSGSHMEYCLLGDTANTAARLEALGKGHARGGADDCVILIGETTWRRLGYVTQSEAVGAIQLRGKQQRVTVYRIHPASPPAEREPVAGAELRAG